MTRMPIEFIRKSLELTQEQWDALDRLAEETDSTPPAGPTFGEPSWRTLIKRIANGEIVLKREGFKMTDQAAYNQAEARLSSVPELEPYRDIILYDWHEGQEHWEWVTEADAREIIDWAESVKTDN